jgi:GNAT superfamily N-acetyltransferase
MSSPAAISIREMTIADIPAGLDLCRASHWNQTARDWRHFLHASPHGALVAVDHDTVVGTVATLPYGSFAWISMVLVDPASRGRGIGRLLLERGLELVPAGSVARLDATPAGEVIYRKLGFTGEYGLARLFTDRRLPSVTRSSDVRPFDDADWPAVLDMDLRAFGSSRASLLELLADGAPDYAWVVEHGGRLRGYSLGRHGHVRDQLGPLVADSPATAMVLLEAALASQPRRSFFVDVPDDQRHLRSRLNELGFSIERTFLRMHRGRLVNSGDRALVYAIAGPEFG